jgi:uncharacterized protein YbjQ (UPF0145 family)
MDDQIAPLAVRSSTVNQHFAPHVKRDFHGTMALAPTIRPQNELPTMEKPRIVREFKISKSLLGQKYSVSFACPHCEKSLKATEDELGKNDQCLTCKGAFRISKTAKEAIDNERQAKIAEVEEKSRQQEERRKAKEAEAAKRHEHAEKCEVCGIEESFLLSVRLTNRGHRVFCQQHATEYDSESKAKEQEARRKLIQASEQIIVTTGQSIEGFRIIEYLGIDGVEFVSGTGFISEFVTDVVDVFGMRSKMFESKLRDGRHQALQMLKILAVERGANAIIAIDFDYSQFSSNRTAIIVTGTFVRIIPTGPPADLT